MTPREIKEERDRLEWLEREGIEGLKFHIDCIYLLTGTKTRDEYQKMVNKIIDREQK